MGPAIDGDAENVPFRVEAGRAKGIAQLLSHVPLDDTARAADRLAALEELGITRLIQGAAYQNIDQFRAQADALGRFA